MQEPNILVFSAHSADYCSRAGGTLALHVKRGGAALVVDVTFGEQGESEDYWAQPGPRSVEESKRIRAAEAQEAAGILGVTIEFLDFGDYPLFLDKERVQAMARLIRANKPDIIITHWKSDPINGDHEVTAAGVLRAASLSYVPGFDHEVEKVPYPYIFGFEPSVPLNEMTGFHPDHYVAIDEVFDLKMKALRALRSQSKLVGFYTQWAEYRGFQARQTHGNRVRYAEAFQRYTAVVDTRLPGPMPKP
jgi:4-oxalomesaconate hydratase